MSHRAPQLRSNGSAPAAPPSFVAAAPSTAPPTPAPALADLPLVSIHSVFKDSFVRVNARGGLRADAEFPWSYECWYRLLPEVCAQDAGGAAAPGEQQQPPPGEPAAAADDDPDAELERRLGSTWFGLRSERLGRLLLLHGKGKEGSKEGSRDGKRARSGAGATAFVPFAELESPRARRRRAPGAPWRAPPGACWRFEQGGLRNRGTNGWLNVRPGGELRGHGNSGPPWRVAHVALPSTALAVRALPPELLRGVGLHANGSALGAGERRRPPYALLSVDYHIATARDVGHTLRELGATLVEQSLSGACGRRKTCAQPGRLGVLSRELAFTMCPRPHALRRAAYEARDLARSRTISHDLARPRTISPELARALSSSPDHLRPISHLRIQALRTSPLLSNVDGVVCAHPAALCEVRSPPDLPLISGGAVRGASASSPPAPPLAAPRPSPRAHLA
jgi:hypothetical protein